MVAAAIIAGGRGTRLGGVHKHALLIDGQSFLDRQLGVLRPLFPRLFLVTGAPPDSLPPDVERLQDRPPPGRGPLAGLEVVLEALGEGEAAVCLGGDMPLVAPAALHLLRDFAPGAPAVVPRVAGFPEPLFARYGRACLPVVRAALAAGRLQTSAFAASIPGVVWLDEPSLRAADPPLASLENVNTPDDLQRVRDLIRSG